MPTNCFAALQFTQFYILQTPQHILQRADADNLDAVYFSHAADADRWHDNCVEAQFFSFLDALGGLAHSTNLAA